VLVPRCSQTIAATQEIESVRFFGCEMDYPRETQLDEAVVEERGFKLRQKGLSAR
jgi:hypothetical protein